MQLKTSDLDGSPRTNLRELYFMIFIDFMTTPALTIDIGNHSIKYIIHESCVMFFHQSFNVMIYKQKTERIKGISLGTRLFSF